MLGPFEYVILTINDAEKIRDYILRTTAVDGLDKNYKNISKVGLMDIYTELTEALIKKEKFEDLICQ